MIGARHAAAAATSAHVGRLRTASPAICDRIAVSDANASNRALSHRCFFCALGMWTVEAAPGRHDEAAKNAVISRSFAASSCARWS